MLDDLKMIHERDAQDALGIAGKEPMQLVGQLSVSGDVAFKNVYNVAYAGMGGSALAALLAHSWPALREPFEVVRDYDIPAYVDGDTLFVASSYSGNTEETLSALAQAEAKGAQIAVITSGGKLKEIAEAKGYPLAVLPQIGQPRYAVLSNFRALLLILRAAELVDDSVWAELERVAGKVSEAVKTWQPDVPTSQNPAKQLALELIGKSIVVYAGPKLYPAAYKWKISFNENAKHVAWVNQYSEFNHNEFLGWTKQPLDKPYAVVEIRSPLENERIQKRFEVSERLLSGLRPAPHVVVPQGESIFEQLAWSAVFGEFVSIYVALLNGLNPTPVDLIERLKRELAS